MTTQALSPERLYEKYRDDLLKLAANAVAHGFKPEEVIVMAIDVDDPKWHQLAKDIGVHDGWDACLRELGIRPVQLGSFTAELVPHLVEVEPRLAIGVWHKARHGYVRAIIMSNGCETVRYLRPVAAASAA